VASRSDGAGACQDDAVLSVYVFDGGGPETVADPDTISDHIGKDGTVVWVDLLDPTDDELMLVQKELSLHPLAVEDVKHSGQRPKFELFEDHAFVIAYAAPDGTKPLVEVDTFVGRNWIMTTHEEHDGVKFEVKAVLDRCQRTIDTPTTASFLTYTVLDEIVDTYFGAVDDLGEKVDEIEERIFADEDPEADELPIQRELLELRKELLAFRRRVVPLREVLLMVLRDDVVWIDKDTRHYFQDILDHVMRVSDEIDTRRELLGNAVDAHLAMVSNHMNMVMKKMSSWGAILIVATLLAGIFGMNFDDSPEFHIQDGFHIAIGIMVGATLLFWAYFKRKRWL
jgi:magnesium transporter